MCADHDKNEEQIYYQALSMPPAQRQSYLEQACGENLRLLRRVEALLKAHDQSDSFLEPPPGDPRVTLDHPAEIDGPGTEIGRYELLELIGEGGMGLVYLAEQKEPVRRKVALKIIKPGMDSKQVIARFEAERQALALLDHPNIAHVFDADTTDTGRPYFVMEHVKGLSITRYCDDNKLTIEQRLRLFEQVCEAVHHAHQKGIIHRDLKPSNILVSVHGDRAVPKIIDFGIAKAITSPLTDKTFVTFQGQLLGTPEYMSPEQVDLATQDIDTRSDIYSLGVVLYELLAGVLPFESDAFERAGLAEIQQTIREQEPASPSIRLTSLGEQAKTIAASRGTQVVPLARRLHRELEWIPLKAMRKDRCRRYRSATEMADDVHNYLTGRPLLAGPETTIYRVQKFVRKHAGSVATAALVVMAIILGLVVSTAMYLRAEDARQKEATARAQAEQAKDGEQRQRKLAEDRAEDLRRSLYANGIQLADAKYREGNTNKVRELLAACPNGLRGWEWSRLNYISDQSIMTISGHQNTIHSVALSPDGKQVVSGGWGKAIKMWDAASGVELLTFSGHEDDVRCVAFSPDGKRLASGSADRTVKIWDVESGIELRTLRGHDNDVWHVTFSPDGRRIASATHGKRIKIWDAATGVEVTNIQHEGESVGGLAFSPDGKHIASGDLRRIRIWDANSGAEAMSIPSAHRSWVTCVAYSRDGKHIVSCGGWDPKIKVWDTATGKEVRTLHGHSQWVYCVDYDSSGRFILSGNQNNTISIWDAATGEESMTLRGHRGLIRSALFSHDGKRIISGSDDKTIKLWYAPTPVDQLTMRATPWMFSVSFSPDSKRIVSAGPQNQVTVWDTSIGAEVMSLYGHEKQVWEAVFSPDGRHIASASRYGVVKIWDAVTGKEIMNFSEHKGYDRFAVTLAYSPDGKDIAVAGRDEMIRIYDATTGTELMTLRGHEGTVYGLAFSPDGKRIVSAGNEEPIRVWDVNDGTEVMKLAGHTDWVYSVSFSPDGKLIVSGGADRKVKVWDAATGSELMTLQGHNNPVLAVSFSPDGRRLVSASRLDGTIIIWDVTTGAELMTLPAEDVYRVAFSPDGNTIAALYWEGLILWETTKPSGGYAPRQTAREARELVDRLYEKNGYYYEVINRLENENVLDETIRKLALPIANSRCWRDVYKLNEESWKVVSSPEGSEATYREALNKAEKAVRLNPHRNFLNTLGVAQYRVGAYQDALITLSRTDKMRTDSNEPSIPHDLAFLAMAQHRLGRDAEAKATIDRLRILLKDGQFDEDTEVQAFLAETEGVIEGKKP